MEDTGKYAIMEIIDITHYGVWGYTQSTNYASSIVYSTTNGVSAVIMYLTYYVYSKKHILFYSTLDPLLVTVYNLKSGSFADKMTSLTQKNGKFNDLLEHPTVKFFLNDYYYPNVNRLSKMDSAELAVLTKHPEFAFCCGCIPITLSTESRNYLIQCYISEHFQEWHDKYVRV